MAVATIHRWSAELYAYQYKIQYYRSEDHSNADMMTRSAGSSAATRKGSKYTSLLNK